MSVYTKHEIELNILVLFGIEYDTDITE